MDLARYIPQNLNLNLGSVTFSPSYLQAGAIIFLIFLLLLTLASVRRHFIEWSFKGALFGIFFGFLLALILEGFLIIGGKTAITEIVGWKNAPKPLLGALDAGRGKLIDVLGVNTEVPEPLAKEKSSVDKVIESFQSLAPRDAQHARQLICQP